MRLVAVLESWIYKPDRMALAKAGFDSLAKSAVPEGGMGLLMVRRAAPHDVEIPMDLINNFGMQQVWPEGVVGTDMPLLWGTQRAFDVMGATHVVWLVDDSLYNSAWIYELGGLINRHPDARAWTVCRSANYRHHKTIREEGEDCLVTSMTGCGMTFTKEEWEAWGVDWRQGNNWPNPVIGNSIDLHHAYYRPGERWAAKRSYMDHTGKEGIHTGGAVQDNALEFVGV